MKTIESKNTQESKYSFEKYMLAAIVLTFISSATLYVAFSVIEWSVSPATWSIFIRGLWVVLSIIIMIFWVVLSNDAHTRRNENKSN